MTLRTRLALTVLLAAVPLVAGLFLLRAWLDERTVRDGLRTFALTHMEAHREACEADPERFGGPLGRPPPRRRPGEGPGPREPFPGPPPPPRGPGPPPPEREGRGRPPAGRDDRGPPPRDRPPPPPGEPGPVHHEIWAYRPDLASDNPAAPPLPPDLADAARAGETVAGAAFRDGGEEGYQVLVRTGWANGPCAFVLLRRFGGRIPGRGTEFLGVAALLLAALLVAVLLAAGPLVRRIRRLTADVRRAAESHYEAPVEVAGRDEIAGLATAFNEAGRELRKHVRRLEEREATLRRFVANTTHDVMIPLTVLQGHLSALRDALAANRPPDDRSVAQAIEEVTYMGSLMHNLGAAAKLETAARNLPAHPVDLAAVVERAVARHRPIADARGVEINHAVPEDPVVVTGDVTLIEQAVGNVVQNAVRYNRRGGHVAVVLSRRPGAAGGVEAGQAGGHFVLEVVDDGPGIPPEEMARLPERRFRGAEARTRHPEGSGLGLHIARDVARRHGFDLAFTTPEHGGLAVTFRGPLRNEGPSQDPA